jgi:formylglycine-generating enzyme required for sulfatase activity
MTDEELLADLLIQWEEALEEGRDVSAADLCNERPHLVEELSRRIEALRGTSWMDKPVDGNGNNPPPTETPDPETPPRTLVNRYRLDQKVAEGGFAQVWKGYDLELLRTIAVKMPKPSHIGAVDSFMAEARRVARLKHPGIVPVHDVGKDGDDFFIVSEFVEDGSLGDRLKQGPIPPEQSCRWLAEIADALDYAHKNGVIHRDIKPANILIDHHGRALLADFGIALSANKTGQFAPSIGTLAYMSPEQLEGKPLDPRSDVYSAGVLLCQLLTGKLPYDARDTNSLRKEIVSGAIRLSGSGEKLTPELRGICLKCLAHDPKERYATAKDLANDLRSVQPIKSHRTALVISGIAVLVTLLSVPFVWNSFFKAKEEGQQPVQVAATNPTNKGNDDQDSKRPDPITNSIGMVLIHIPAGEFLMGTPENDPSKAWDEIPHRVRISTPFFMGKYEVTQSQYQKVMGKNPSYCAKLPNPEQHPVEQVSWDDAVAFCRALSELPDEKAAGRSYRLPTEAEWEYACRAGTTTAYHFGSDPNDLSKYALFGGHKAGVWVTQKVGIKLPNAWGLHDMHGNVWEWCSDEYGPYRVETEVVDPQGPDTGVGKVARGGSWDYGAVKCRSAQRYGGEVLTRSFTNFAFGFRVVMVQEARP